MKFREARRVISVLAVCGFLLSCEKPPNSAAVREHPNLDPKSVTHLAAEPQFEVKIELPTEAAKRLSDAGETIMLSASFADEIGPDWLYLGGFRAEVKTPGVVKVFGVHFNEKILRIIPDKNYEVLMNVYSGRRADDRNLLDCDSPQGRINDFQGKSIVVKCVIGDWASKPKEDFLPSFTGEMKGKDFKIACSSVAFQKAVDSHNDAKIQFCIGFVKGIVNAVASFASSEDYTGDRLFCLPRKMSDIDYTILAIQRAEKLGINDDAGISNAITGGLHEAFPCGK